MIPRKMVCAAILLLYVVCGVSAIADNASGPDPKRLEEFNAEQKRLETKIGLTIEYWSIEDIYNFYTEYDDVVAFEGYEGPHVSLPKAGEIMQDDARELAVNAVISKHGEDAFVADFEWTELVSFQERKEDGSRFWTFVFMDSNQDIPYGYVYEVHLDASTGEVIHFADDSTGWG